MGCRIAAGLLVASALAGCAANRYAGVDLRPGYAPTEIQALARDARAGRSEALLALARRFEAGDGVPVDLARAMSLYAAILLPPERRFSVYQPPINGQPGQAIPVTSFPQSPISREAVERLAVLVPHLRQSTAAGSSPRVRPRSTSRRNGDDVRN